MPIHARPIPSGSYLLRLYRDGDSYERRDEYVASCVLSVINGVARIEGLVSSGRIHRGDIREAIELARSLGASVLRIERAKGHVMPYATYDGREWVVNLSHE